MVRREVKGRLVSIVYAGDSASGERTFQCSQPKASCVAGLLQLKKSTKVAWPLGGRPTGLVYNHGVITNDKSPKASHVLRLLRASGLGAQREVVPMIYPRTHHHPIFWTWAHVGIEDQHYDLWPTEHPGQPFVRG